jgi:glycosyltransferase involved in cell wall biosynthesis
MHNITAVIKSFLREPYLFECYRSLKEMYPTIRVIVADDSLRPGEEYSEMRKTWIENITKNGDRHVALPFDSGVCVGRNRLIDMVETPFVLIGDDDFQYRPIDNIAGFGHKGPMVDKMKLFLEERTDFDLIGGRVYENLWRKFNGVKEDRWTVRDYQGYFIREPGMHLREIPVSLDQKYPLQSGLRYCRADLVFNFFVARASCLRAVRWNENIKVAYEHSDFFLRFKDAGGRVAFSPDPIVIHKPNVGVTDESLGDYKKFRMRREDKVAFFTTHHLAKTTDMRGYSETL